MRQATSNRVRGIRWTLLSTLEDLDFADGVALHSHTHRHRQDKTTRLIMSAQQVGLKISQTRTDLMMLSVSKPSPIQVNGENLLTTEEFTYLGSTLRRDGGAGTDIKNRLNRFNNTRDALRMLNNACQSTQYSPKTKLRRYQSCVRPTLLYISEC